MGMGMGASVVGPGGWGDIAARDIAARDIAALSL